MFWLKNKLTLKEIIFYLIILILFLINSSYVSYPDEFVNLMGGVYINQGMIPYLQFFDHHLPFAWYFGSLLLKISFGSFVLFRTYWAIFSFVLLAGLGLWVKRNYRNLYLCYLGFFLLYPLISVYFWLHLYLADSLAVLFFSLIFWILLAQTIENKIKFKAILVTSLLTFCLIFSSMTFLYLGLILYLWQLYLLKGKWKKMMVYLLIAGVPYIGYLVYLVFTRTLSDFYFANFTYNTKLYMDIPNYTRGRFFNPLKFAFTLIFNFWEGFLPRLTTIKDLNLYLPVATLTTLGSFLLLIVLLIRNIPVGVIFFFLLSFSAPRSNILKNINDTDYQVGLFVILGIIASTITIYLLRKLETKDVLVNDLCRLSQLLLSVLLIFTFAFLVMNTYNKWYLRYTQKMPGIYDKADTAVFLDEILNKGDYYWVGPYEPNELFFVKKGKLPGKYISLLPQFSESEYLKKDFIKEIEKHPPKVIILKTDTGIFGNPTYKFAGFLLEWMKERYTLLEDIKGITILKSPSSFKLDKHLYLLNTEIDNIKVQLKVNKYIE